MLRQHKSKGGGISTWSLRYICQFMGQREIFKMRTIPETLQCEKTHRKLEHTTPATEVYSTNVIAE